MVTVTFLLDVDERQISEKELPRAPTGLKLVARTRDFGQLASAPAGVAEQPSQAFARPHDRAVPVGTATECSERSERKRGSAEPVARPTEGARRKAARWPKDPSAAEFQTSRCSSSSAELVEFEDDKPFYGRIRVMGPSGAYIDIEDELWAIILNLCFRSLPDLIEYKSVTIRYYSYHGYLRVDPEGGVIRISGDNLATQLLPESELLPALFHCGKRFVEVSRRLGFGDEMRGDEPAIKTAEQALKRRKLLP